MDTDTVLKIIAMLDARIDEVENELETTDLLRYEAEWIQGQIIGFKDFKNHLQAYIESQVNQVENDMNRGE